MEDKLLRTLRPNLTNVEIAHVFNRLDLSRSPEGIRKRSKLLGVKFVGPGKPNINKLPADWREAVEFIFDETPIIIAAPRFPPKPVTSSEKAKATTNTRNSFTSFYDELLDIRSQVEERDPVNLPELHEDNLSLNVLLSDFHVGRVVEGANGEQAFNVAIATERLDNMFSAIMEQTAIQVSRIDEVILLLAGDMVDGEGIYPGQEMQLETHVPSQTKLVTRKLWGLITSFAETFPAVRVVTVRGNHGRTNGSAEANWDTMVYQSLELLLDMSPQIDNITISNRYGLFNTFETRGWKGMLRHWAPVQAHTASAIKTIAGWYSIHDYDLIAHGHFHHWGINTWNGKVILRNGALYGGDDYAESFGAKDDPHQLVWTTSYEKSVHDIWPVKFE
jgi:hypothetical protein